jgi:hypothetical protein
MEGDDYYECNYCICKKGYKMMIFLPSIDADVGDYQAPPKAAHHNTDGLRPNAELHVFGEKIFLNSYNMLELMRLIHIV